MFKNIEVDTPPGYYLEPVNVNITFSNKVQEVLFSLNGAPPSISKYIAYDTSVPPVPFIAVTQDGRGNVTYDGGFLSFIITSHLLLDYHCITMVFRSSTSQVPVQSL